MVLWDTVVDEVRKDYPGVNFRKYHVDALAASGNINPERKYPSMFEPIHGSAPDIKGKGIANPIGAIWAGALMLDHLGEPEAHTMIVAAITKVLSRGNIRTPDMGGNATTKEMAAAIQAAV